MKDPEWNWNFDTCISQVEWKFDTCIYTTMENFNLLEHRKQ